MTARAVNTATRNTAHTWAPTAADPQFSMEALEDVFGPDRGKMPHSWTPLQLRPLQTTRVCIS